MTTIRYLESSLDNIESWLSGYMLLSRSIADNYSIDELHQLVVLYDEHICSIIHHCKNLVNELKAGDINET